MDAESVRISPDQIRGAISPGALWNPKIGDEAIRMARGLPEEARDTVLNEAAGILGRCVDPGVGPARRAGLIVGGVQSGKTASFTAVTALAADNGIPLVIILAGTKRNLLEQSRARLEKDLGLDERDAHFRWTHYQSPEPDTQEVALIANQLEEHLLQTPDDHRTMLITVMKHATHMRKLADVLEQVGQRVQMESITSLIIDDEADQATPNLAWRRGAESPTYRNLREIRGQTPRHTLLQYTATPQAPLLVSIADEISPEFTAVLTPGRDYTGGRFFFQDHADVFVRVIPSDDLAAVEHPIPPASLFDALASFFVGVAAGLLNRASEEPAQRSMLVHPSQATAPHGNFAQWIRSARDDWVRLLTSEDSDRQDLIEDLIHPAYLDLQASVAVLPEFDELLERLPIALRRTRIEEVNVAGGQSPRIDWNQAYSWILIGGAMMDRGFTVEGLTVTYMPRNLGVGNADTIQQRARFFGYKRSYAGFCRAWLGSDVAEMFRAYVEHEETMHDMLLEQAASGESLKSWRRRFLLDARLQPTRRAVASMLHRHRAWSDDWFVQNHIPLPATEADLVESNREVTEAFLPGLSWSRHEVAPNVPDMQVHLRADIPLREALEGLLGSFAVPEEDASDYLSLMVGLSAAVDRNQDLGCVVFQMSQGTIRRRSLEADTTKIKNLFQGRSRDMKKKESYPGDRAIRVDDVVTIQIHRVTAVDDSGNEVRSNIPVLAIWIPESLGFGALVGD